jgi:hypothetical protein
MCPGQMLVWLELQAGSRELRALLISCSSDQATSTTMQTSADATRMRGEPSVVLLSKRAICSLGHIHGPPMVDAHQAHPQEAQY